MLHLSSDKTAIESMKLIIFICKNRFCILCSVRWYLFFLNKYFIISTIIWCYAVYSDSHQNMTTWVERNKKKRGSGNFYNHMQLHNLFYYNNMMFQRMLGRWAGANRIGRGSTEGSYEYWNANTLFFCAIAVFFSLSFWVIYFDHLWN